MMYKMPAVPWLTLGEFGGMDEDAHFHHQAILTFNSLHLAHVTIRCCILRSDGPSVIQKLEEQQEFAVCGCFLPRHQLLSGGESKNCCREGGTQHPPRETCDSHDHLLTIYCRASRPLHNWRTVRYVCIHTPASGYK